ncbi:MAG: SPFH domain-containing protein [Alphaproteobacteria bacterium]|nr:SPFH domain-containing protein [Alphaproteobacteria bacterium]
MSLRTNNHFGKVATACLVTALGYAATTHIDPDHVGVTVPFFGLGKPDPSQTIRDPGWHLKAPWNRVVQRDPHKPLVNQTLFCDGLTKDDVNVVINYIVVYTCPPETGTMLDGAKYYLAPFDIWDDFYQTSRELTAAEIRENPQQWLDAARHSLQARLDQKSTGIQILSISLNNIPGPYFGFPPGPIHFYPPAPAAAAATDTPLPH